LVNACVEAIKIVKGLDSELSTSGDYSPNVDKQYALVCQSKSICHSMNHGGHF
jgi:hypothetical protein